MAKTCENQTNARIQQLLNSRTPPNQAVLREMREMIYGCVLYNVNVLPKEQMYKLMYRGGNDNKTYKIPKAGKDRLDNFKKFVDENFHFYDGRDFSWPDKSKLDNIYVYELLKQYSQQPYGAAMIRAILDKNKTTSHDSFNRFLVNYNPNSGKPRSKGGYNSITISNEIGKNNNGYHPGGEKRFGLSLIHHEFGHTQFGYYKDDVTMIVEKEVVIRYSNPVRVYHKMEPRYTYAHPLFNDKTIGIVDVKNKIHGKRMTIREDDPRKIVSPGTAGARK